MPLHHAYIFTVTCLRYVFGLLFVCALAGGGWHDCDWRALLIGVCCGRSVCACVWGVEIGDRLVDVCVSLGGACCVGWCAPLQ